jgi:predicted outer membrane repeat protein
LRTPEQRRDSGVRLGSRAAAGAGAALGATILFAPVADAATFTVTSLDDSTADGTLRGEIVNANTAPGDDVIAFASGLSGTITLDDPEGDIEITTGGLEIQGPGAGTITVNGNGAQRIFYLHDFTAPGTEVGIAGLTLTGGDSTGFVNGGAILSSSTGLEAANLTVRDAVITGNFSEGSGGGIYSDGGNLAIHGSTFTDNRTGGEDAFGGGGVFVNNTSGTPADDVEVVIEDSTISGNHANYWGGALYLSSPDGDARVTRTTMSGNEAINGGGGAIDVVEIEGDLIVEQSTFANNTALYEGGAMNLDGIEGNTEIANSTISGNRVTDPEYSGGAIYFEDADSGTDPVIRSSTLVGNSAPDLGGAIYLDEGGPVRITNTIIADNSATDGDLSEDESNATGGFELNFSLVEGTGGNGTISESPAGSNLLGIDPQLGALADNGGPTQTHLPALASPVVDGGFAGGLAVEQRGLERTGDLDSVANRVGSDATDMGSVEIQAAECQGASVPAKTGTEGSDNLVGTGGPDALAGLGGNDTADGRGGKDCIAGDAGKDKLKGGGGKDLVTGGAGKDRVSGQGGKDKLKGDAGKDALKGGGGKDKLKGGPGKDRISSGGGKDRINCGAGKDKVNADPKDRVGRNCETVT